MADRSGTARERRWTRRRLLALGLVTLATGLVAVAMLVSSGDDAPTLDPAAAAVEAARACRLVTDVERRIEADAAGDTILSDLRRAERTARSAAEHDPRWLPLSGGVSALRIGLEHDQPRSARTGIGVVRAECREVTG